jgi:predicted transcriptional regulator
MPAIAEETNRRHLWIMSNPGTSGNVGNNVVPLPTKTKGGRRAEDKWSPQVMKFGYTPLPNLLLKAQGKLKITPMQFNVLVQVVEHWWEAERDPYPAKDTIARRMNKSPRQVQRYLTQLEDAGMIKRIARYSGKKAQINNAYSFDGLIKKLKALEPDFSKEAEQKRLRRKRLETAAVG